MELEKQYTDVVYATKKRVADEMGYHLIEPIWKQIEQYRSQFMISFSGVELCLCPGILKKMMILNECLFKIKEVDSKNVECMMHSETGSWMMHHLLKTEGPFEVRLRQLCLLYQKDESIILHAHHQSPYALIFLMWCFMCYGHSEFGILLVVLKMKCAGLCSLLSVMDKSDFDVIKQQDMTYLLDESLTRWISKAQQILLSCSYKIKDDHLKYLYPQLKKYQIHFYQDHHTPGHYYTIEQFMEYSDVCYETGRTSMEQLVSLGLYAKMKQGKKFVYTAR